VGEALAGWGVDHADPAWTVASDAVLVSGELLANAVAVCAGPIEVEIEAHRSRIRVAVMDDAPGTALRREADMHDEGGRGLAIVEALSARWGQRSIGHCKQVWADLDVHEGSVLGEGCQE
jgi:Histidine kinase-like ATPase domain